MGQCMSRKAAGALAASAAVSHKRPGKMQKHQKLKDQDDDDNKSHLSGAETNIQRRPNSITTKGVAMSFGFKRRTAPSIAANATAARRLASCEAARIDKDAYDGNGNSPDVRGGDSTSDTDALTGNAVPTGRSTPRLAPPKKEATGARVSRFGFRSTQTSRLNKVADLNTQTEIVNQNGNTLYKRPMPINRNAVSTIDNNRNKMFRDGAQPQISRFKLQSTQLPRPEPIKLIETKSAKTLANTNKRVSGMYQPEQPQQLEDTSSKDGSLTEDSGVGSHLSGFIGDNDIPNLESSPSFGPRRKLPQHKPRNLEMVVKNKTFDVRDLDDSNDSCDSVAPPPLPQLPSAFNSSDSRKKSYQTGLVRERTMDYQRHLEWDNRGRKISATSSEGFSDDYGEEEKTYSDRFRSEKTFIKTAPHQTFLKSRSTEVKADSSPPSSDDQEWVHGGEAMAEEINFSLSSSDESKDKNQEEAVPISAVVIGTALQSLMSGSLSSAFTSSAPTEVKNVMLTIEDPKFAAVAAASNTSTLLDDETLLSPADSVLSYSESDEVKKKLQHSSSNSKDINEKPSPPTPGTPTNASNSLSLSDGKDDFLIDDEIADQPALVFEDNLRGQSENYSLSSEKTIVLDSTPKLKRKTGFEGSPLSIRNRKFLQSRTGSLDTLSPCESIASDDLMMDYDFSQSSGVEDCDKQSSGYPSFNDTLTYKPDTSQSVKGTKDWNSFDSSTMDKPKSTTRTRLLRSRASTPNSVPDSPRSLEGRASTRALTRPSATSSPARPARLSQLSSLASVSSAGGGYDSDDSIRLDRANHVAMKQDIMSVKTMLLKLKRVLNESETHSPFDCQASSRGLTNGIFNGPTSCPCPSDDLSDTGSSDDNEVRARMELADLRRQVLFLQGQLEDREKTVQQLREQMIKLAADNYHANSAPASTVSSHIDEVQAMCNAATQTERIRPISAGPSLLNGTSPVDGSAGSLVSASNDSLATAATHRQSRPSSQIDCTAASKKTPLRLWRRPGEPPSPQRFVSASSIPKRADSRTRMPAASTT